MSNNSKNKIFDNIEMVEQWAFEGISKKEIAKRLGVTDRTLRNYEKKNERLFSALNNPTENMSNKVEYALLKCALGYSIVEEELVKEKSTTINKKGDKVITETYKPVKVQKTIKADVNAQKFWLNNRKQDTWKDNPHKVQTDKEILELRKKELEAKEW